MTDFKIVKRTKEDYLENFDKKTTTFVKKKKKVADWLFEYPEFADMINALKTEGTKKNYTKILNIFFRSAELTPAELLAMSDTEIYNLLVDYFRFLERTDRASLGRHTKYALKKFLRRQGRTLEIRSEDDIEYYKKKATTDGKHIPTKTDVFKMLEYSRNPRNKAILICLFQSALRVSSMIQLTYGMVKDYLFDEQGVVLEDLKLPIPIRVSKLNAKNTIKDGKVSKHIVTYYCYLGDEAALALIDLIQWRKDNEDWEPQDDDYLFTSQGWRKFGDLPENYWKKPISKERIGEMITNTANAAGLDGTKIWTHLFRTGFQNHVDRETGDPIFSQLLMGHTLQSGQSATNYGDYGDTPLKRKSYMEINWTRSTVRRVWQLEQRALQQNGVVDELRVENEEMKRRMEIIMTQMEDMAKEMKNMAKK